MNCNRVQSLLMGFVDETLDAGTAWQVQTHLPCCDACRNLHRDLSSVKQMLHTLPAAAPSAGFDAALAQRLAMTRRPAAPSFRTSLSPFRTKLTFRRLRPALALSLVLVAGTFTAFYPGHAPVPAPVPTVHAADPAFVADCVAQHHRDAAAEPLADLSAQTLAGTLDSTPPDSSADPNASADSNAPADSSLL